MSYISTVQFETLGCRLNQDETEGAARFFLEAGFKTCLEGVTAKTPVSKNVSLCIVNTCTVTTKAEQKARRIIRLLLEKFPQSLVLVTGCYAELNPAEIISLDCSRIAVVPGTQKFILSLLAQEMKDGILSVEKNLFNIDALNTFIKSASKRKFILSGNTAADYKNKILDASEIKIIKPENPFTLYTTVFEKHSRASIKIQDGCNNNCSFCRIHLARGKSVSLEAEEVVRRVKMLERQGITEAVFTGVNLSQYYWAGSNKKYDFAELLKYVLENTENIKLRISSLYPQSVTDSLCSIIKNPRIQNSFHLSIQSGSERILSLMERPYKLISVYSAVEKLRKAKENPFISCDIIAGFPSETDEDFNLTKKMCTDLSFAYIHAFPFSPRPGTKAFSMKMQIPERIKNERVKWLSEKAVSGKIEYINLWQGKTVSAVLENSRALRNASVEADIGEYKKIHVVTENFLHGEALVPAKDFDSEKYKSGRLTFVEIGRPLYDDIVSGKETECSVVFKL